jgi:hypothetical protein
VKTLLLVVLLSAVSLTAQAANDQFTLSNGGASAVGYSADACKSVYVNVNISRSGTHNLKPSNTPLAEIDLQIIDSCANTVVFEVGSVGTFQLVAPGAPSVLPRSVQASGTMTATCYVGCSGPTDFLTFSLNLQAVGSMTNEQKSETQTTFFGITTHTHSDINAAIATGTVSVSSAAFGALPISNWQTQVSDQKTHSVSISN